MTTRIFLLVSVASLQSPVSSQPSLTIHAKVVAPKRRAAKADASLQFPTPDLTRSFFGSRIPDPDHGGNPSDQRHLFVFAPDTPQRVAHLADGGVSADAVEQRIHRIRRATRSIAQSVQRSIDGIRVAGAASFVAEVMADGAQALVY